MGFYFDRVAKQNLLYLVSGGVYANVNVKFFLIHARLDFHQEGIKQNSALADF